MFVAGLMHDVGKMLISPTLNEHRISAVQFPGSVTEMEYHVLGIDHTEASALVATKWGLAETVQEVITQHHSGAEGPADYRVHCAILRVANAFAHELGTEYVAGQCGEAVYAADDLKSLDLRGRSWDQARLEMGHAITHAMAAMGSILG